MRFLFTTFLFVLSISRISAQQDTVKIYLDRAGKTVAADKAARYTVQYPQQDRWKKLVYDKYDGKLEQVAYYKDPACTILDGSFTTYYKNQLVITQGAFRENKREGVWKSWSQEQKLTDSAFYKNDLVYGLRLRWNRDGSVSDSSLFEEGGNGSSHGYWPDGVSEHNGSYKSGKRSGLWTYYYKTGNRCQEVNFEADSAVSFTCYEENGQVQKRDCYFEKEASFKGGETGWRKYLQKKLSAVKLPKDFYKGKVSGTVFIQFIVDKEGKIKDVKTVTSVREDLDEIAMEIIRNGPDWEPAVQYNRAVNAYRRQPITFAQYE